MNAAEIKSVYPELLKKYLFEEDKEAALFEAYNLGQKCFEAKIGIDEIMNLHTRALEDILKNLPPSFPPGKIQDIVLKSSNLILEFSIKFGLICQNYFEILKLTDERIRNAFYQAGMALTTGMDLEKMFPAILNLVKNLTDSSACAIMLIEDGKTTIKTTEKLEAKNIIFDEPVFQQVLSEGHVKFVNYPEDEESRLTLKDGTKIRSVFALPLSTKGKTFGSLGIFKTYPYEYKDEEIRLLTSFAYEVSSAIDNAFLFSELQRHDRTLSALHSISTVVVQSLEIQKICKDALSRTIEITESDVGGIYLLEDDGITLSLKVHSGVSEEFAKTTSMLKVGQGVTGMAVKTGKPVSQQVSAYSSSELLPILLKEGLVSLASTPLMSKGKVIGALTLSFRRHHPFSRDDLELLASIGSQIGVAIENSRLYGELDRHHKMLKNLYSIERVVSRSLDIEEIFEVSLTKALEATETEAGTLYSLEGDVLHLKTLKGLSPEFREKAITRQMGEGIPGIAAQSHKPISLDISDFPSHYLLPYVKKEGLVSFIGTPLMSKGKVVGAMALGTKKERVFTDDDLDLMLSIGNVIGIAMENAKLYKKSRDSLEKLEKAYDELKTLDKMKDEFISNISHELKTPLISIKGYGELIYDRKLGSLTDDQKKSLEAIIRNTDRLTRLINSILFITRLQAGKVEFKFEPLDVNEMITTCQEDFKAMLDKKNISFEKDIHEISRIKGDKDRFIEIISNLIDNAIKFTEKGGKIKIGAWDEGENVHIVVSDNGIGIPADIIPHLFTRFYQVDASNGRKYGGTGLGLYITKNIVDGFSGKIWIESEEGKGTTVHLTLPAAEEDEINK